MSFGSNPAEDVKIEEGVMYAIIILSSNIIFRPALNNSLELLNQTNKS